jgi:hypothetical protein
VLQGRKNITRPVVSFAGGGIKFMAPPRKRGKKWLGGLRKFARSFGHGEKN